ncbi:MAG: GNAT family N-acetyltransferase [Chitinophagaceae bacterium]
MLRFTTSTTNEDLSGIKLLQENNLRKHLTAEEIQQQGFVTVSHSLEDLRKMNAWEQNVIMKDHDKVVGYLLAMTKNSNADIPVLIPMFNSFDNIGYKGKMISDYNYLVVGQVCIDKNYRGQGLLDKMYEAYKDHFQKKYDFAITEISTANQRSINAHHRIGFKEIFKYTDAQKIEWSIVIWNWRNNENSEIEYR